MRQLRQSRIGTVRTGATCAPGAEGGDRARGKARSASFQAARSVRAVARTPIHTANLRVVRHSVPRLWPGTRREAARRVILPTINSRIFITTSICPSCWWRVTKCRGGRPRSTRAARLSWSLNSVPHKEDVAKGRCWRCHRDRWILQSQRLLPTVLWNSTAEPATGARPRLDPVATSRPATDGSALCGVPGERPASSPGGSPEAAADGLMRQAD